MAKEYKIEEVFIKLEEAENAPHPTDAVETVILDNVLCRLTGYKVAILEAARIARRLVILKLKYGLAHEEVIRKNEDGEYINKYSSDQFTLLLRNLAALDKNDEPMIEYKQSKDHSAIIEFTVNKNSGILKDYLGHQPAEDTDSSTSEDDSEDSEESGDTTSEREEKIEALTTSTYTEIVNLAKTEGLLTGNANVARVKLVELLTAHYNAQ